MFRESFNENHTAEQIAFYMYAAKDVSVAAKNYLKVLDLVNEGKISNDKWDEIIRLIIKKNPEHAQKMELKRIYAITNDKWYEKIIYNPHTKTLKFEWFIILIIIPSFLLLFFIVGQIIIFFNTN